MTKHNFTAKPWKTPIDDPDDFHIELVLYRQNYLLIIFYDDKTHQRYSLQVNCPVHIRYIHDNHRFSIWCHPQWKNLNQNGFTCEILKNSNFQINLSNSENLLNYFLVTGTHIFEILTNIEPEICSVNDAEVEEKIDNFINSKNNINNPLSAIKEKINNEKFNSSTQYSAFQNNILNAAVLDFEFMVLSDKGVNFIVTDQLSKNHYKVHYTAKYAFQCIQLPNHGIDYFAINKLIKQSKKIISPLWKLESSQLLEEANDLEVFLDKGNFGSLYIKTSDIEVECVTKKPPQISFEDKGLKELILASFQL